MKKVFVYMMIFLSFIGANEFLVERKISSVKEAQETLCSLRVDIMRLVTDVEITITSVLRRLAIAHDQFQEDFFSFAIGEKGNCLSSKDKQLLNKKVEEARLLKEKIIKIQAELELFLN